jgi:ABC-type uncharacterized transport system ATPase subunit
VAAGTVDQLRAIVGRKHIRFVTRLPAAEVRSWSEVESLTEAQGKMEITSFDAEAVARRLLAADADLRELEVRRASLSEALALLTGEAA